MSQRRAFSLVEILVALTIIGIVSTMFIASIYTGALGDNISRAANAIYGDLVFMRMRAVSLNTRHRIHFTSTTEWRVEMATGLSSPYDWEVVGSYRRMPNDTYLTSAAYANAATSLEAKPNGLYEFQGGATGAPFATIQGLGIEKTKSIQVAAGGAVQITSD